MHYFKIKEKTGWGFINLEGDKIIDPNLWSANDFSEGLAFVTKKEDDKYISGFINLTGEWEIDPVFEMDRSMLCSIQFKQGLAPVLCKNKKWKFIKKSGDDLTKAIYEEAYEFSEDRALVKRDGKYGYIDENGDEVIPCQFGDIGLFKNNGYFHEKLAVVRVGDAGKGFDKPANLAYINRAGELFFDPQFSVATRFSHDFALVAVGRDFGSYRYMTSEGEIPFPQHELNQTTVFSDELSEMYNPENELYGYIDLKGNWVIDAIFSKTLRFTEGLAAVNRDYRESSGFINKSGEIVIPEKFSNALPFHNGLASVQEKGKRGYINKTGEYVWKE